MFAWGQTSSSLPGSSPGITPPPPFPTQAGPLTVAADSIMMPFRVQQTVPQTYEELMRDQFAADLTTPSNVKTEVEYDPATGFYVIRTKVGDTEITTPLMLSEKQYNDWQLRRQLQEYYQDRNQQLVQKIGRAHV